VTAPSRCQRAAGLRLSALLSTPYPRPRLPSDYGLTRAELSREALRLRRRGWPPREVERVLTDPRRVPVEGWCG
jgi:hypothetical protein